LVERVKHLTFYSLINWIYKYRVHRWVERYSTKWFIFKLSRQIIDRVEFMCDPLESHRLINCLKRLRSFHSLKNSIKFESHAFLAGKRTHWKIHEWSINWVDYIVLFSTLENAILVMLSIQSIQEYTLMCMRI
jgi:hypothetical protein